MKHVAKILYSGVALSLLSAGPVLVSPALVSPALATGFSTEGVDPAAALFSYKRFEARAALAHVWANREYEDGQGQIGITPPLAGPFPIQGSTSTDAAEDYNLASGDLKIGIGDNLDCAARWHEPYKLTNRTDGDFTNRYYQSKFFINSEGIDGTCSIKFPVTETGLFRILGGVRTVELDAVRENYVPGLSGPPLGGLAGLGNPAFDTLNVYDLSTDDRGYGYRIGGAFEIPAMALRAQIIYDSEVELEMSGTQTRRNPMTGAALASAPVTTSFALPQAISARIQTGVNPTTLVWVGARWQEWSSIPALTIEGGLAGDQTFPTDWEDGWTVEAGVGKKLTDTLSVRGSVTWNEGIGGGYTDTWTFAGGTAIKMDENVTLNLGASATLITASSEEDTQAFPPSGGLTATADSSYDQATDWAFGIGAQIVVAVD